MLIKRLLLTIVCLGFCTFCYAGDEVDPVSPVNPALEWEKKYYIEHSLVIQLKAMNQVWNNVEFQDVQRRIREINKLTQPQIKEKP